ncbi:hypothetical protein CQ14_09735 [Bradyrhizobium lablabi]|uniref:3-methyladenine DNA glycosylase n=1 Tax=Bradyrhizobium lablabi TaxID=722472 RepID=A0A0R3N6B1_9BRAD|nr:DNA-3-methyladenine glycosylase [Bradyrhizobium lablabi]KRR25280.1 hypothetical protein CQ14_09735 [Bradyrhizobium lablabi]
MIEFFGKLYVPLEPDFLAAPSCEVGPRLIGSVIAMDYRGGEAAIALADLEAYDQVEGACHNHPTQRLSHGHAYVHPYHRSGMLALDLVCGPRGRASSVLIRAGIPVFGLDVMAVRRSAHPESDKIVQNRARGYERRIASGPGNVGEAFDVTMALDGAWLFDRPFRIYRPVAPITDIEPRTRVNITRDAHPLWRWKWRNPPWAQATKLAA